MWFSLPLELDDHMVAVNDHSGDQCKIATEDWFVTTVCDQAYATSIHNTNAIVY